MFSPNSVAPSPALKIILVHVHSNGAVVRWEVPAAVEAKLLKFTLEVLSMDEGSGRESLIFRVNNVNYQTRAFNLSPLTAGHSYMAKLNAVTAEVAPGSSAVLEFMV